MKKSLLFLVCLLLSVCCVFAQDEQHQPKGQLLKNEQAFRWDVYATERLLLDWSAQDLAQWNAKNWRVSAQGIATGVYKPGNAASLISKPLNLPALLNDGQRLNLYVQSAFELESYHDKGLVQVSADGGKSWETLATSTGRSDSHTEIINLTPYAGKSILLAFNLVADGNNQYKGWTLENVSLKLDRLKNSNTTKASGIASASGRAAAGDGSVSIMGALTGQMTGVDAQRFPRYIYSHFSVDDGGSPLLSLTKPNFTVKEFIANGAGGFDTLAVADFDLFAPTGNTTNKPVDIVFLMDNSGSMSDEQAQVTANVTSFVNQLASSGFDFRLGICRFGQAANSGRPIFHDNARFYSTASEFTTVWNAISTTDGGAEPSWDALYESTTQYSFRAGAQRIFILITDESITGNNIGISIIKDRQVVINQLLASGVRTYTLVSAGPIFESDFGAIATATGGQSYLITSPFNAILQDIGTAIDGTYTIRYAPTIPVFDGIERNVQVKVTRNTDRLNLYGKYTPGAAPIILRTDPTLAIHRQAQLNGVPVTIEVEALDWDNIYTSTVTLFYRKVGTTGAYSSLPMTRTSQTIGTPTRSLWSATIPGAQVLDPGIEYYVRASDGQATTIAPEFIDRPGFPFNFAVLPNIPPVLNHTPISTADPKNAITITAEATDNTLNVAGVYLYWKKESDPAFPSQPVAMTLVPGTNTYQYTIPALNTNTIVSYYLYAEDNFGIDTHSGSDVSPHTIAVGVPWTTPSTPYIHTIRFFNAGAFLATVTVDGQPLAAGDIVAVFFNDNGVLKPAGSMTWPQTSLVAYGDNPNTTTVKEGFATGETFTFKIFRKSDGEIFDADYTIHTSPLSLPAFQNSKQTFIKDLIGYGEHVIQLQPGLNLWSTYVNPRSAAFSNIMAPIGSALQSVEDSYGNTYTPGGTGALTTHVKGYGYRLYMNSAATLRVKGSKLNPTGVTVNLTDQGIIVGSPYPTAENVEAVFPRLDPNIYIVDRYITDASGSLVVETYSPTWDINTWTTKNLEPGKGYYVYTFSNQPFTFPASVGPHARTASSAKETSVSATQKITSVSDYMHLIVPAEAWSEDRGEGDEIRVYNKQGKLVGKNLIKSNGTVVILDGAVVDDDEKFSVRLWDNALQAEKILHVAKWFHGNNQYRSHTASVIGAFDIVKRLNSESDVYPNPVLSEASVSFSVEDEDLVSIELYDVQGTGVVKNIANEKYSRGVHEINFNKQGLKPGVYLVKIKVGQNVETRRLVVK
jgi:hypothetical protein